MAAGRAGRMERSRVSSPAEQLDLISSARLPAFARGSDTSRRASERVAKGDGGLNQREIAYRWVVAQGRRGATRNEIHKGTGILIQSLCQRLSELTGMAKPRLPGQVWPERIRLTVEERDGSHVYVALVHLR